MQKRLERRARTMPTMQVKSEVPRRVVSALHEPVSPARHADTSSVTVARERSFS